jgi:hypothetical protein
MDQSTFQDLKTNKLQVINVSTTDHILLGSLLKSSAVLNDVTLRC